MNVRVEMLNSMGCPLDERMVGAQTEETLQLKIKMAIQSLISQAVIEPGDTIKITEIPSS